MKPSEQDPETCMMLVQLAHEAGLPNGALNVIHGQKEAVDALCDNPHVQAISFVGGDRVGQYIYERGSANGKRVQANMVCVGCGGVWSISGLGHILNISLFKYSSSTPCTCSPLPFQGAKNHGVVMPDANKEHTINQLVGAAFGAAGQRCMALSTAVFVGESKDWIPEIVERSRKLSINEGMQAGTDLGPLISPEAKQRVLNLVQSSLDEGAKVRGGGW